MLYHFIGIKGSGMASLAEIVNDRGDEVNGSDIEKYIFTQKPLEERGIQITGFDEKKATVYWYHEFLGQLVQEYTSVSVAGTHGKTTTTGMLSHVMSLVAPTGYLIGDGTGEMPENSKYFVLESCEYQRHFLAYEPQYAIITNIELDHVDYYKDMADYCNAFETFANQVKKGVVIFGDDESTRSLNVNICIMVCMTIMMCRLSILCRVKMACLLMCYTKKICLAVLNFRLLGNLYYGTALVSSH